MACGKTLREELILVIIIHCLKIVVFPCQGSYFSVAHEVFINEISIIIPLLWFLDVMKPAVIGLIDISLCIVLMLTLELDL